MKNVILSADNTLKVYSVPDAVADNLIKYCNEIAMELTPCFDERDFIEYLNTFIFVGRRSELVKDLKIIDENNIPEEYRALPRYNF